MRRMPEFRQFDNAAGENQGHGLPGESADKTGVVYSAGIDHR
jgi:hypothetical protein